MAKHYTPNSTQMTKNSTWKNDILDRLTYVELRPDPSSNRYLLDSAGQRWRHINESQKIYVEQLVAGESATNALLAAGRSIHSMAGNVHYDLLYRYPVVGNYYLELCEKRRQASTVSKEDHLSKLAEIRDLALADRKWSPAITAEVARGRVEGLYVQKLEVEHTDNTELSVDAITQKLESKLAELLGDRLEEKLANVVETTPAIEITSEKVEV